MEEQKQEEILKDLNNWGSKAEPQVNPDATEPTELLINSMIEWKDGKKK